MFTRGGTQLFLLAAAAAGALFNTECTSERPASVPADATYINAPKGGTWQVCRYDDGNDQDLCAIYNAGGGIRDRGVYLPYDGGRPARSEELQIVAGPADNLIFLANGRVLLLKEDFENQKHFLDETRPYIKRRIIGPNDAIHKPE